MTTMPSPTQALSRFRAAVAAAYGDRLERVVLFGSRARGDFRPESDYDVAVFLRESDGWLDETIRLAEIGTEILMDTGSVISAKPFLSGAFLEGTPLMREIRRDGIEL